MGSDGAYGYTRPDDDQMEKGSDNGREFLFHAWMIAAKLLILKKINRGMHTMRKI